LGIFEKRLSEIWDEVERERQKLSEDPVTFFEEVVGFRPTVYQRDLAEKFMNNQFTAMRWNRQSGKSWIAAALLLNYALIHPGSYIGVVAPGWPSIKACYSPCTVFFEEASKRILS